MAKPKTADILALVTVALPLIAELIKLLSSDDTEKLVKAIIKGLKEIGK